MKKILKIGLTTIFHERNVPAGDWYVHPDRYDRSLTEAGAMPIPIPAFVSEELCDAYLDMVDGMLFIGGPDLPPSLYTDDPILPEVKPMKKGPALNHLYLARKTLERNLPCLGICLGMQELYIADGGKLIQHIGSAVSRHKKSGMDQYHTVTLETGSRLETIFGCSRIRVNSAHHQAGNPLFLPKHARITARCGKIVEAIEFPGEVFRVGVQWHPERIDDTEHRHKLFTAFTEACRQ